MRILSHSQFMSVNLPSCFNFSLVVFPNPQNATAGNYSGTPPYYMMAFPEGGQPLTTLVGVSNDTLSWLPQHPVGREVFSIILVNESSRVLWQVRD